MVAQPLHEVLRSAVRNGVLPVQDPIAVWGSWSVGRTCSGCGDTIAADSAQIDLEFLIGGQRAVHPLHPRCWLAWEEVRTEIA